MIYHRTQLWKSPVLLMLVLFGLFCTTEGTVNFNKVPGNRQFFPRDENDSGVVVVSGNLIGTVRDSIVTVINKDGALWRRSAIALQYRSDTAVFDMNYKIHAELAEYQFSVYLDDSMVVRSDSILCGDVYVIGGQSNAEAPSNDNYKSEWIRTMDVIKDANLLS